MIRLYFDKIVEENCSDHTRSFESTIEETFWADYILKVTTEITTKQTAAAAQKAGAKQAEVDGIIIKYRLSAARDWWKLDFISNSVDCYREDMTESETKTSSDQSNKKVNHDEFSHLDRLKGLGLVIYEAQHQFEWVEGGTNISQLFHKFVENNNDNHYWPTRAARIDVNRVLYLDELAPILKIQPDPTQLPQLTDQDILHLYQASHHLNIAEVKDALDESIMSGVPPSTFLAVLVKGGEAQVFGLELKGPQLYVLKTIGVLKPIFPNTIMSSLYTFKVLKKLEQILSETILRLEQEDQDHELHLSWLCDRCTMALDAVAPGERIKGSKSNVAMNAYTAKGVDGRETPLRSRKAEDNEVSSKASFRKRFDIYSDDPSPLLIAGQLSEAYWQREAWKYRTIEGNCSSWSGPVIQLLSLCWGPEGVNITRFKRGEATRLESSVDMLGMSLSAVYTLLTFRVSYFLCQQLFFFLLTPEASVSIPAQASTPSVEGAHEELEKKLEQTEADCGQLLGKLAKLQNQVMVGREQEDRISNLPLTSQRKRKRVDAELGGDGTMLVEAAMSRMKCPRPVDESGTDSIAESSSMDAPPTTCRQKKREITNTMQESDQFAQGQFLDSQEKQGIQTEEMRAAIQQIGDAVTKQAETLQAVASQQAAAMGVASNRQADAIAALAATYKEHID
ncbi:hypothetical protein BGX27_010418 [Mortierella sp. AM989]|nr:hypothetical protein BGX27_010418 [Mortierella sp. AM989]